ncbi:neutral/alkaline non-lysosomal ceramidase N-terminal domain-containing protein [Psychrobacter sp. FDAARGOS_221]|uniref:neutral/alkaline non-lysosomal ceramidase N-terminal domain-containing protein n=1 Tax=Psychrobacter sp. FDAARGOS_221 TaxID=1975705 RepID=UPI000BB58990|nr:neutral/alkaline non-lysosomal ceramidase N-terminal domain-containing protein [Psychrobacter sp. FDAARGOS_221]PNK60855.1 alkaline ceramidase [Psychrobacter sp. FDAARGOS_221]
MSTINSSHHQAYQTLIKPLLTLSASTLLSILSLTVSNAALAAESKSNPPAHELTNSQHASDYLLGVGQADITGAAAETGMFGYAAKQVVEGLNDRLYAHAYIVATADNTSTDTHADANTGINNANDRIVYVSADMGAMFTAVKLAVLDKLHAKYGDLYNDTNVMLTATHTHVGNAGYSHQRLYQVASMDDTQAGYSRQNFNAIVDGIVRAIERAHDTLAPGQLSLAQDNLSGATRNRSEPAYNNNADADKYTSNVNERMTQLRFDSADGTPLGLINWFAIHPTSFSSQFKYLSADNKGYAQLGFADYISNQTGKPFVAAFANADSGDVVAAGGNAYSAAGYEGSDNEWENVIRDGSLQLNKAKQLWSQGQTVSGPIATRARWVELQGYQVDGKYTQGAGAQRLCQAARGYSFAAGAENGPSNIPGIYEGMTRERSDSQPKPPPATLLGSITRGAFSLVSAVSQDDCQAEKKVLLPTGKLGWVDSQQPVQLMRIGNLAIVAIPGEPTTMVGRRLRQAVLTQLQDTGVDTVIVNGLANNYSGYVTTREEYALQHYEGASTAYGPYQSNAYLQEYTQLAQAMRDNTAVSNSDNRAPTPQLSDYSFAERPGVSFDDTPPSQHWGQVLTQPNSSYNTGDTATAVFRGAHPKNNLRSEDSFLIIQRQIDGQWVDYLSDADFDTTYSWQREGISYSKVTIDWRIGADTPAGTYRIVHQGDWKNGADQSITAYRGASRSFTVNPIN